MTYSILGRAAFTPSMEFFPDLQHNRKLSGYSHFSLSETAGYCDLHCVRLRELLKLGIFETSSFLYEPPYRLPVWYRRTRIKGPWARALELLLLAVSGVCFFFFVLHRNQAFGVSPSPFPVKFGLFQGHDPFTSIRVFTVYNTRVRGGATRREHFRWRLCRA